MKKVFSILIGLLIVISWVTVIYRNGTLPREYANALADVRNACDEGYYVEAQELLNEALALQPDSSSYEADELQRDIYKGLNSEYKYVNLLQRMIKDYPEQSENYESLIQYYYDSQSYKDLSRCLEEYARLWPESNVIQTMYDKFEHQYRIKNTQYYDVKYVEADMISIQKKEYEEDDGTGETYINRIITASDGDVIFDEKMKDVSISSDESMFFVCDQDNKWVLVDSSMNLIAKNNDVKFEWIGRQGENGIAPALINSEYHYINRRMVPNERTWDYASAFRDDRAAVCSNGSWALATTDTLTTLTEYPYKDIAINDSGFCTVDGIAVVEDEGGYCVFDSEKMTPLSDNRYEEIKAFNERQPAAYRKGNKWGFVSPDGNVFIDAEYEDAKSYSNGYAAVKRNGLWGIINKDNVMIVEPQFSDIQNVLDNGYVFVQNDEKHWDILIIDKLFYAQ